MIHRLQVPGPISDVEEVRVLQWHGEPGHAFAPDELIVEVETHKAVVELRAQQSCVLRAILCAEGEWARIGATLALASDDPARGGVRGHVADVPAPGGDSARGRRDAEPGGANPGTPRAASSRRISSRTARCSGPLR